VRLWRTADRPVSCSDGTIDLPDMSRDHIVFASGESGDCDIYSADRHGRP
jgi:hypothetical protein